MEFSVDDGVRLVRSLTDKVRSALSNFLIKSDTDQYSTKWDEEEHLQSIQDSEDFSSHFLQIRDVPRPSRIEPSTSQDTDNGLSNYVDDIVKHKTKLLSANLIKPDIADNILKRLTNRNKDEKEDFIVIAKKKDMIEKPINNVHSKPSYGCATFTNDDLKQLGVDNIMKDELLPLDKLVPSGSLTVQLCSDDRPDATSNPCRSEMTSIKGSLNMKQTDRMAFDSKRKPVDTETEVAMKEFEKDIIYLSGCKNKTSTPEKHAQYISTESFRHKSPDIKLSKRSTVSPKRSPYRRFVRPVSPLVANSPKDNISSTSATKHLRRAFGRVENIDDDIQIDPNVNTGVMPHSVDGEPLLNISPASERWMRTARLVHAKRGVRRSLFSEQRGLSRYLPLTSLQTHKPLGYEAYQQFLSVSKSDVLPKYFFENEDEEAVYYLKVKYLDEVK